MKRVGNANILQDESVRDKAISLTNKNTTTARNVFAYVRVSDSAKQDSSTQRHAIVEYSKANDMNVTQWQEFHLSGSKTSARERGIEDLLNNIQSGDIVLVSDIARLGRDSIHQVLNTITSITTKGAEIHFCYSKTVITPKQQNDISSVFIAIGEAYAAVKFSEERSQKAKAASERRRLAGLHTGRPVGCVVKSKLDDHAAYIIDHLNKGTKKTKLVELLLKDKGVSITRLGLYKWLARRNITL